MVVPARDEAARIGATVRSAALIPGVVVEVALAHRVTGDDWRAQLHRARQLLNVARALTVRLTR